LSHFVFPDNTVLCNFAAVNRLDLLKTVLLERGRWTEALAYEAERSSREFPALAGIKDAGWLGDPIAIIDVTEVGKVERIRRAIFGGSDDKPLKHLGEAQTCYMLQHRSEFEGSWWVSDDREALEYGRRQRLIVRETVDLVIGAASYGDITAEDGFRLLKDMDEAGRALRVPNSAQELGR
jgi:hypothetical protein